jgi:O-antigen ligase
MLAASALIIGLLAGPWFCVPFAVAAALVGLGGAWSSGLRWTGVGLTLVLLAFLGSGAAAGELWSASTTYPMVVPRQDVQEAVKVWSESLPIVRDFPWLGTGLGTFSAIYPFYKEQDPAATTAMSSLLQWWIESGAVGLMLLALAGLWAISRAPGALQRVGTADRALAFGLIAAALGFTLFSAVHWTVELASVSIAASAVGGTLNRWLAGGTDLFVERG